MRRIIIDTDPGVDDSMAILFALASPELQVEALTTVFGNGGVEQTTRNALTVLELAGRSDIPVATGASRPLLRSYRGQGYLVHGHNGLGDADVPPPKGQPSSMRAAELIVSSVMASPGEITLVPIGPLTNIALAVSLEPRIADNVREVVIMGGAATVPGNASPLAEANIYNDPEAAKIVFQAGWPLTMVGLDVTRKTVMTPDYLAQLWAAGTPATDFIRAIIPPYMDFHHQRYGLEGFHVHDPSAVAYVVDPGLFRSEKVYVDVEIGDSRASGQTMADWYGLWGHEPNANVCLDVDSERLLDLYLERLSE